jgi:hypothetical protein
MALRTARFRRGGRSGRRIAGFAGLLLLIATGGCSPVETYRSLVGVDLNDPDPHTAPFSHNLAEAETGPYPNLASVPPPPVRAMTTAERQKLAQKLIADRRAAAADAGPAAPRPAAQAKPAPPLATAAVGSVPAARAPAPAASPSAASSSIVAPAAAARGQTAANSPQSGRRSADEPPEPGPLDSNLQMPEIGSVPEPEATRPPLPPPALAAVSPPARMAEPAPAALASAMPQPAPPAPDMTLIAPPAGAPPAAGKPAAGKTEPKRAPAATTVARLDGPGVAGEPNRQDRAQIERVATLYKDKPGTVRVVAYAAAPAAGSDPLDSYHFALERAQAVAKALAQSGIPAGKIQTAATPAAGAAGAGRVDIQFAP